MSDPRHISRLVLLADPRQSITASSRPPMRRFRLARLDTLGAPRAGESRFEHLKRTYD